MHGYMVTHWCMQKGAISGALSVDSVIKTDEITHQGECQLSLVLLASMHNQ